jgi:hypothetical protein
MEEVSIVARDLLAECISSHNICVSTKRTLPTRVLQIFGEIEALGVRLIETKGMPAVKYFALSHCWGPIDKQPLRTTRTSYSRHLHSITQDQLPKTFKDAILLTRLLNIEYLWIDSLCIIQDNEEDWRLEAGKMADVYRNATLVISASEAKDSTEGLFITERKRETVMAVPYIAEGIVQGTFNIAQLPERSSRPKETHLNTRAWAFQERLLARRIMFFTRGGMYWKCREFEILEHGIKHFMRFHENDSWLEMLREYSKKELTNAGDRLYALQGVVEDMRDARGDHYYDSCGVWESDLYKQLLWRRAEPILETEILDLPTWTWAATGGAKFWCLEKNDPGAGTSLPRAFHISSSGALLSSGHISQGLLTLDDLIWPKQIRMSNNPPEWSFINYLEGEPEHGNDRTDYLIRDPSTILGLAVFDREPSGTAKCFFVARQDRNRRAYSEESFSDSGSNMQESARDGPEGTHDKEHPQNETLIDVDTRELQESVGQRAEPQGTLMSAYEDETDSQRAVNVSDTVVHGERDSGERDSVEVDREGNYRDGSGTGGDYNEGENSVKVDSGGLFSGIVSALHLRLFDANPNKVKEINDLIDTTDFVYWCLLLEPAGEGKYTRVGVAILYPRAFEALGAVEAEFEII